MDYLKIKVEICMILLFVGVLLNIPDQILAKKLRIHIPFKVKHHHHVHTVIKHVHHQVPVPVENDHDDIHVIHPDVNTHGIGDSFDSGEAWLARNSEPQYHDYPSYGDTQRQRAQEYSNFGKVLKKRSKKNNKVFNNQAIGWSGRKNFDKIASEYLNSLKRQRVPVPHSSNEDFPAYTDDDEDGNYYRN